MKHLLALIVAASIGSAAPAAFAEGEPIDITWSDLAPQPQTQEEQDAIDRMAAALSEFLGGASIGPSRYGDGPGPGVVPHGGVGGFVIDGETLTEEYDDKLVRMPGYALPLDWTEDGVTQFLLVPFIGACLHVPPPPANQLVLINTEKPYVPSDYFEAVTVTGVFSRFKAETEMIESGYRIVAEAVTPYEAN